MFRTSDIECWIESKNNQIHLRESSLFRNRFLERYTYVITSLLSCQRWSWRFEGGRHLHPARRHSLSHNMNAGSLDARSEDHERIWDSLRQGIERTFQRPETINRSCLVSMVTWVAVAVAARNILVFRSNVQRRKILSGVIPAWLIRPPDVCSTTTKASSFSDETYLSDTDDTPEL